MTQTPADNPYPQPAAVLELLQEQATLYGALEQLAGRQRQLITRGESEMLLTVLGQRQQLTDRLQTVAQTLGPVRQAWSAYRDGMDSVDQARAEELLRTIQTRFERVRAADEQDAKLLAARKQAVAGGLQQAQAGRAAISAYQTGDGSTGRLNQVHDDA